MDNPDRVNGIRFHDVEFSSQSISLYSQQSKILSVAKKDVRKVTLKYGFQSERPLLEVGFGIVLIFTGIYFIVNFILQMLINRIIYTTQLLSVLLLPVGVWFIADGFRKRFYFEVALDNDKRKFPLGKKPDKGELQKFIKIASQLGYSVDAGILDKNIVD